MAGSKSTVHANSVLNILFRGTAIADIAENDTTSPLTDLYVRLYEAAGADGDATTTNETDYPGYVGGVAVNRTGTGWDAASGGATQNTALVLFPAATSGTNSIMSYKICSTITGAGVVYYWGDTNTLSVTTSVAPEFAAGAIDVTET